MLTRLNSFETLRLKTFGNKFYRCVLKIASPEARTNFIVKNDQFKVPSFSSSFFPVLFLNSGFFILAYALVMLTRLNSFETLRLTTFGKKIGDSPVLQKNYSGRGKRWTRCRFQTQYPAHAIHNAKLSALKYVRIKLPHASFAASTPNSGARHDRTSNSGARHDPPPAVRSTV